MSHDVIKMPLEDIVGERFGRYSKYIIQERALPDVRDGLKPVQRRILFAMHQERNNHDKPYRKSAKTVGIVIGNYHPHGDSSVYEAMVRLSQSWKVNMPLIDMQGNNGSIDDDPAAAMRYTEARLSKLSHSLLENIDEEVVPFVLTYDDEHTEPSILPARFPNLIVNGATGIAAGYATNIPPFNLEEILNATIHLVMNPESTIEDLSEFIKGPDFPTAAIIQGQDGIDNMMRTGRGRIVIRAKTEIIEKRGMVQIVATELPYEVIKSNVVRKIDELRFEKAVNELSDVMDVRDESDRNGLKIVVDCKKDSDTNSILNLLFKETDLQVYYNANMVSIIDQRPQLTGIVDILKAYIHFRQDVILKRSHYRLSQRQKRIHIIEGLIKAVSILDEIIATIRASKNRGDSRDNLIAKYGFTHEQASAIVDLQLYRLSSTDIVSLKEEFKKLSLEISELEGIINNREILNGVMIQEFYDVMSEFDTPRKSVIEKDISELEIDHLNLIANEEVIITLSYEGYIKKVGMRSYNSSQQDKVSLNDEDKPVLIGQVNTLDQVLFMTSKARYGYILVHDIEEARWRDIGSHLNQYVKMDPDEKIISAFMVNDFETHMFVVTTSQEGMIKKTALNLLEVKRNNRLFDIMNLDKNDKLIGAHLAKDTDDVLIGSHDGQFLRLELEDINPQGLRAKGMIALKLREGDFVAHTNILSDQSEVYFLTDRYQFKRVKASDINVNNRNTMGVSVARKVKSNPHHIKYIGVGNIQDHITLYKESLTIMDIKDIPLMGFDSTYSQVIKEEDFYIVSPLKYTEHVSAPKQETKEKVETLKLEI
ncbi:MAG: DNA topoisomerase IV subunit A [Erysipelothrix sp.]|nr:DNA topoisomerase IV subunit A [Erysipelothrix sp.]